MKKVVSKIIISIVIIIIILPLSAVGYYFYIPDMNYLKITNPEKSSLMVTHELRDKQKYSLNNRWLKINSIPKEFVKTLLIAEDASFYFHNGYDLEEIKASFEKNMETGKVSRGGSTITQQLAKNLFLSTDKSYIRKLKELIYSIKLENTLPKKRILEIYLNIIEMDKGVFGMENGSFNYYGKSILDLNIDEFLGLVCLIPRPVKEHPGSTSKWYTSRYKKLHNKLVYYKVIED
ncbi:MAG: transglycosylase domain-containing protein [Candidatus Delongbacteria bacterium]|nr:transglycosylase domain-containing protein [Candidatus Delongbacteria bacterium]MBN2835155.1 transglycosylase domain-containing protein [Candidatus Delongbacteria bacterium]